jgi:Ca2+-binding RTX toxin-like protein
VQLWEFNGYSAAVDQPIGAQGPGWQARIGDFNGDGLADVMWTKTGSDPVLWEDPGKGTTLVDGSGNNLFTVSNAGDAVTETSSAGNDTLQSFASVALPTNVNTLQLMVSGLAGYANSQNDQLYAASGGDTLGAGVGNDTLTGNGGYDVYQFGRGNGQGVIQNAAGNTAANGELDIGAGVATNQLWLQRAGNDLQIDIMGTASQMTVSGWYTSGAAQLQHIVTADGSLLDGQLNSLVAAMATFETNNPGFNPTASANTQAPNDPTLQAALAAAWHH